MRSGRRGGQLIISHSRRFIFVKTVKTGGTSLEMALSKYCAPGDVLTPLIPPEESQRRQIAGIGAQNYQVPLSDYSLKKRAKMMVRRKRENRFYEHTPAWLARRRVGDFVRGLIRDGLATAVHDCSDGGLAVAVAEMAMASGIGAAVNRHDGASPLPALFGEDQGRYVLTVGREDVEAALARARAAEISAPRIGTTGGTDLKLGDAVSISVAKLKEAHDNWFPAFMAGEL